MQLNPVRAAENDDNEGRGGKPPAPSPSYKQAVSKAITRFISPADATLSQSVCVCVCVWAKPEDKAGEWREQDIHK